MAEEIIIRHVETVKARRIAQRRAIDQRRQSRLLAGDIGQPQELAFHARVEGIALRQIPEAGPHLLDIIGHCDAPPREGKVTGKCGQASGKRRKADEKSAQDHVLRTISAPT